MAKSRSTVRWVTGNVSDIFTVRVYIKFTRERLFVFYVLTSALQMYVFFDTILFILTNSDKCKLLCF